MSGRQRVSSTEEEKRRRSKQKQNKDEKIIYVFPTWLPHFNVENNSMIK